ncbi:uncharacterized protein LOC107740902 [Sinocyclocheilus rhinocerous]|uniref:uncharacterized protein LOC107740902 n=1 Tax=Sinocyclocheilus rhinocerous TaxID=307959 RepID=UPI0007BA34BB|nr:PREDICTED: uncharacterized protein LOC107740902 [Sinocyclocheilus rhinocerous]
MKGLLCESVYKPDSACLFVCKPVLIHMGILCFCYYAHVKLISAHSHCAAEEQYAYSSDQRRDTTKNYRMCSLDEVPFKVALDSVELGQKEPVTAPEFKIPDCVQILRDTKYSFTLEKKIMAAWEEQQWKNRKAKKMPQSVCPTCPPYWLMFSSPQQSRRGHLRSAELWELGPRPCSLSLSAADSRCTSADVRRTTGCFSRSSVRFESGREGSS